MRFVFYLPDYAWQRATRYDYKNMMEGGGFSGTDASVLEMSHALVSHGHTVWIILGGLLQEYEADGIYFLSAFRTFELNFNDTDVFCPLMFLHHLDTMSLILCMPPTATFVFWLHSFHITNDYPALDYACRKGMPIKFFTPSDYVSQHYRDNPMVHNASVFTVGNAINTLIFAPPSDPSVEKRPGSFCFHASFDRGGKCSHRVFERFYKEFGYGEFNVAYYDPKIASMPPNVNMRGSLSKTKLKALMDSCEYFVYALSNDEGGTHHDTYACVVHEALACGVIVISWDVACLKSLYGDAITLVDPLPCEGYNPRAPFSMNPMLLSDQAIDKLYEVVRGFEQDPKKRAAQRQRGYEWAFDTRRTWGHQYELLSRALNVA